MNLETDSNWVKLTLNGSIEAHFKKIFEIEMLQGVRKELDNGQIYYEFVISDEKMRLLKQWVV
jgi:hypothetical protein